MDPQSPLKPRLEALFESLGNSPAEREEKLHSLLHDFYQRLANDTMIGFFFFGKDLDLIAGQQAGFLLRAMGARATYSGKAPSLAHLSLPPILEGHFNRRLEILKETLRDHSVAEGQIQTWLEFENVFKNSIVR
jgi:hemoglobin